VLCFERSEGEALLLLRYSCSTLGHPSLVSELSNLLLYNILHTKENNKRRNKREGEERRGDRREEKLT
jgi:hypothetical protein